MYYYESTRIRIFVHLNCKVILLNRTFVKNFKYEFLKTGKGWAREEWEIIFHSKMNIEFPSVHSSAISNIGNSFKFFVQFVRAVNSLLFANYKKLNTTLILFALSQFSTD